MSNLKDLSFSQLLDRAGMTKAKLARTFLMTPTAISLWGNNPPRYARAYLELLVAYKKLL
jgi:hypothetical protein